MKRPTRAAKTLRSVNRLGVGSQSLAGVGVDIVEIERMERAIARTPRILQRVFSDSERSYAKSKARPAVHYALFFAAKEAVLKTLGTGFTGMKFTDVEVDHDRFGKPLVLLHGHAQDVAREQGVVEVQLSLSYTHQVGVASAVAIKAEHRPRKEKKYGPHEELARQFKEMRALLDTMDTRLNKLDANALDANKSDTDVFDTDMFDANILDANKPETAKPETTKPETAKPETNTKDSLREESETSGDSA